MNKRFFLQVRITFRSTAKNIDLLRIFFFLYNRKSKKKDQKWQLNKRNFERVRLSLEKNAVLFNF